MKQITTINDVLAIANICPEFANAKLFDTCQDGILNKGYNDDKGSMTFGPFFDVEKKEVFRIYTVVAERDEMVFFMKEIYSTDGCYSIDCSTNNSGVLTWHSGPIDSRKEEYDFIMNCFQNYFLLVDGSDDDKPYNVVVSTMSQSELQKVIDDAHVEFCESYRYNHEYDGSDNYYEWSKWVLEHTEYTRVYDLNILETNHLFKNKKDHLLIVRF